MNPRYRFLVINYQSKPNVDGNTEWMSEITSTVTGNSMRFLTPHDSNTAGVIRLAFDCYPSEIALTMYFQIPIMEFKRLKKWCVNANDYYEDKDTASQIKALEL